MNSLFIANVELDENEGIYKKICAQSEALCLNIGNNILITKSNGLAVERSAIDKKSIICQDNFYSHIKKSLQTDNISLIYVRHMIPSFDLLNLLRLAKIKKIKVLYEIPTYPYFGEQIKASRRKYRAIAKIILDIVFFPLLYQYIDRIFVIRSNSNKKLFKKMIPICNGVKTENIRKWNAVKSDEKIFRMVTVGTLYPYHGYDRILKGLAECHEKVNDATIEFHVIGNSHTIDEMKKKCIELGLSHIYFHGKKTTEELNEMFDSFHVGLGCLALYRRNANIDTTLKVVEYLCRGIPVISSGKVFFDNQFCVFSVSNDDRSISIKSIYDFYYSINKDSLKNVSDEAKKSFSWNSIMKKCIESLHASC